MNKGQCLYAVVLLLLSITQTLNAQVEASFGAKLADAAYTRIGVTTTYDGRYVSLAYPMGDVPNHRGVCTDVIIRSYRQLGYDLQALMHEDMREHFAQYPNNWGLKRPDRNIDHRRVPNLQAFFRRFGQSLSTQEEASLYQPGDIVTWMLPGNLPHVGIVSNTLSKDQQRPLIIHNIGSGTAQDDSLFLYPITGHYRYYPEGN